MNDSVLDILKLLLLALLYLFFARVLWAVWSEVRQPVNARQAGVTPTAFSGDPTTPAPRPDVRERRVTRGRAGKVGRLVVLEPKATRGTAYSATRELTIGRDTACGITIAGDTFVSSLHARVYEIDGQPMVEDLGSTNGTLLNGNRLNGAKMLHIGDRLQIGYTVLEAQ